MNEPSSGESNTTVSPVPPEERQMALFTHLAALAGFVIPLGNIIGPLVLWLIKKDTMPFVDDQGKEALNFNITVTIAGIVCCILFLIVIGYFLLVALTVVWLIFVVIATVQASEGVAYRYPFSLRIIK